MITYHGKSDKTEFDKWKCNTCGEVFYIPHEKEDCDYLLCPKCEEPN